MRATIQERGNGFCDVGDYVSGAGILYRVVSLDGPIHTDAPGAPNYIYAEVEEVDWSDITDEDADDICCSCVVEEEPDGAGLAQ